jgi:4-hydroxy-2-oxoheptanedioate aldolase
MNTLKQLWASGQPALNAWCSIGNAFSAEIMAAQGFDSITVDVQHGALDYNAMLPMFQAMRASGKTLMARVPSLDPAAIMKALDAGAMGIICPMINTRHEAETLVSYLRYPPLGTRSFGPTRAAIAMPGYGVTANDDVLAFAMIETAEGAANLEEIVKTPGLDGVYVGPADLTLGTQQGRLAPGMDREEPEMIALLKRIADVSNAAGIKACLHCGSTDYAARAISWGYHLVTVNGDVRFLAQAASDTVTSFRKLVETKT